MKSTFRNLIVFSLLGLVGAFVALARVAPAPVYGQAAPTQAPGDTLSQVYQTRESAYQHLLQQANQRLEQANVQIQQLSGQVATLQAQQSTPPAGSEMGIRPEKAVEIARQVVGADFSLVQPAEMVNLEGKYTYELVGAQVTLYVDARSGAVLYNSATAPAPRQVSADEAAEIARTYLQAAKVYKVDLAYLNGVQLYRVILPGNYFVYVDQNGQIVTIQHVQMSAATPAFTSSGGGHSGGGDDDGDDDGEHESESEHESEHD